MDVRDLPIDDIRPRERARPVSQANVAGLVKSISTSGLFHPLRVRQVGDGGWEIISGMHRYLACKELGWTSVSCQVVTDSDLQAELAMIDENLIRAPLSPSEKARQTARRKVIYEQLYPAAKAGARRARGMNKARGRVVDDNLAPTFAQAQALETKESERTVQANARIGELVLPEVLELVKGTALDTRSYLEQLAALDPEQQLALAHFDTGLFGMRPATSSERRGARASADAQQEFETGQGLALIRSAWGAASPSARDQFLSTTGKDWWIEHLSGLAMDDGDPQSSPFWKQIQLWMRNYIKRASA